MNTTNTGYLLRALATIPRRLVLVIAYILTPTWLRDIIALIS